MRALDILWNSKFHDQMTASFVFAFSTQNSIVITLNWQVEVAVGKEAEEELVDISHMYILSA